MTQRRYYVYILTNTLQSVLYIGVTNDIARRLHEHKTHAISGFTDRYNVTKLIYVEEYAQVEDAIRREKQLKRWNRAKKEALINAKTRPGRKSSLSPIVIPTEGRTLPLCHSDRRRVCVSALSFRPEARSAVVEKSLLGIVRDFSTALTPFASLEMATRGIMRVGQMTCPLSRLCY